MNTMALQKKSLVPRACRNTEMSLVHRAYEEKMFSLDVWKSRDDTMLLNRLTRRMFLAAVKKWHMENGNQ